MIKSSSETKRLNDLFSFDVLNSCQDPSLTRFTKLAAAVCNKPVSFISFIDQERQWLKACVGFSIEQTPRDLAFCSYTILDDQVLIIPDLSEDERFRDNILVADDPLIRFYAGAPLITPDGNRLGALCVLDFKTGGLDSIQVLTLKTLAEQVIEYLVLMKKLRELENVRKHLELSERARQIFLARISHDLKTPLNGIVGMANILATTSLDHTQLSYLGSVKECSHDLLLMINDLLEEASGNDEKKNIATHHGSFQDMVDIALNDIKESALLRGLQIITEIDPVKDVSVEESGFEQVLHHLLIHVIKNTVQNNVRLIIKNLREEQKTKVIQVIIADSQTPGKIAQEKDQYNNLQIKLPVGLTLAQRLIRKMDSELLTSISKERIEFEFTFRLYKRAFVHERVKDLFSSKKILLIEDDLMSRKTFEKLFEKWNLKHILAKPDHKMDQEDFLSIDGVFLNPYSPNAPSLLEAVKSGTLDKNKICLLIAEPDSEEQFEGFKILRQPIDPSFFLDTLKEIIS